MSDPNQVEVNRDTILTLQDFHRRHFPGQPVPEPQLTQSDALIDQDRAHEDNLGYYADGSKRTLTDEQINMFRHSEIQRLLLKRRLEKEQEENNTENPHRQNTKDVRTKRLLDEVGKEQAQIATLDY